MAASSLASASTTLRMTLGNCAADTEFCALLASGQIAMRKIDGWQTLATKPTDAVIDLAA
jgi:hypothetical protein